MSATLLREAAQTLREKAEAATPGRWRSGNWSDAMVETAAPANRGAAMIADADDEPANAEFIALADPTFALAVADWLESESELHEWQYDTTHALAVARAVLRRES